MKNQLMKSLSKDEYSALTKRTNIHGVLRLAIHCSAIAGVGVMAYHASGISYLAWALMLGILGVFLFTPMHEASHLTAFRTRWINHAVTNLIGLLLILPPRWFSHFHMAHHQHTQDPAHDPELASPKPSTWGGYLCALTGLPVWYSQLSALARNSAGRNQDDFIPTHLKATIAAEARVMIVIYMVAIAACAAFSSTILIKCWVIPALLGQPFLRMYLLAEHAGCALTPNMFTNSRTTLTNWVIRFLAWNMPYHAEHHSLPSVPFHQLPRLHAKTAPLIAHLDDGYPSVHRKFIKTLHQ